ncbi:uncharacterized protein F5891DRAFT_1183868 [Suillus fuscotomentosus]|nr:uncharacterized protein F5891DRAFT_1183868 [Suillus fuscotomentosus]KAG1905162.1 hypothetical protein F5891DRAFT_1183868 [Suillus fuscotomentosus]
MFTGKLELNLNVANTVILSFKLLSMRSGTSTEANVELAAGPATPQAEVACLPVVMKAADDANM